MKGKWTNNRIGWMTVLMAVMLIVQLSAGIQALCECREQKTVQCNTTGCGCPASADTSHCADICPCPVCCTFDTVNKDGMATPVLLTVSRTISQDNNATFTEHHINVIQPKNILLRRGFSDPDPWNGTRICLQKCVQLI